MAGAARPLLRVAFTGHPDHGKSTLMGRLLHDTGSLPDGALEALAAAGAGAGGEPDLAHLMDQLREEREREMTIDTAEARFRGARRDYAIIDAPGHREYIRNMLTGASRAEAAVLVVDVVEGPREQTRRHAALLSLLGIRRVVAAVNKMDLVRFERGPFEATRAALEAFFARAGLPPPLAVPIAARSGENVVAPAERLPWYAGPTLLDALEALEPPRPAGGGFRLSVQDVFEGVALGRVDGAPVHAGEPVEVHPGGGRARVARIRAFPADRADAGPGASVGLLLESTPSAAVEAPPRGSVIAAPGAEPRRSFRAHLYALEAPGIALGEPLTLRCATQTATARLARIERRLDSATLDDLDAAAERLEATEVGLVEVALDRPLILEDPGAIPAFGRFVLEREDGLVLGAGLVAG